MNRSFLLGCGRSIFREGGGQGSGGGADCDIMMLLYDIFWHKSCLRAIIKGAGGADCDIMMLYDIFWHKSCLRAIIKGATWHDFVLVIPTTLSHLPHGKTAA